MSCDNIKCRNMQQKIYEFWDYINFNNRTIFNIDIVLNLFFFSQMELMRYRRKQNVSVISQNICLFKVERVLLFQIMSLFHFKNKCLILTVLLKEVN